MKRYFELLSLRLSALQIADIPRTVDSVSVGTATRVRLNNEKAVFLIGCIDGVFPAVPSASGLFSAYELKTLIANNLPFGDEPADLRILKIIWLTNPQQRRRKNFLFHSIKPTLRAAHICNLQL